MERSDEQEWPDGKAGKAPRHSGASSGAWSGAPQGGPQGYTPMRTSTVRGTRPCCCASLPRSSCTRIFCQSMHLRPLWAPWRWGTPQWTARGKGAGGSSEGLAFYKAASPPLHSSRLRPRPPWAHLADGRSGRKVRLRQLSPVGSGNGRRASEAVTSRPLAAFLATTAGSACSIPSKAFHAIRLFTQSATHPRSALAA